MIKIAGIALGSWLVDGRPGDTPWQVAEMVAGFEPDTVPILSRHGGLAIGYLDTLTSDPTRRNLRFTGAISEYPDIVARLREGALPISIELSTPHRSSQRADRSRVRADGRFFRGRTAAPGQMLIGVAFSERPAAPGSLLWLDTEEKGTT